MNSSRQIQIRMRLNLKKNHMNLQVLEISISQISAENKKIEVSLFQTFQNLKLIFCCLDEEMPLVAVEKSSITEKHHTHTKLLAILAYQFLPKKKDEKRRLNHVAQKEIFH